MHKPGPSKTDTAARMKTSRRQPDRSKRAPALGLRREQRIILAPTVGYPAG